MAGVTLYSLCRLGSKHEQAVDAGDAAALGLEHQTRAGGVVDNVDDALERIEAFERAGSVGAVGEHTGGRAVDEQRCIGLLSDVAVIDLARATHGYDDGAQISEHHTGRSTRTTGGTEHEDLLTGNLNAQLFDQAPKTKVVGIVATQATVRQACDGVDVAHALGQGAQLVQVFHDGALVGDGYVGTFPLVARHKGLKILGLSLKTHVLEPRELLVDGRGVAVA